MEKVVNQMPANAPINENFSLPLSERMQKCHLITKEWKTQPSFNACLPTCIENVISDLSKSRYNHEKVDYKFQTICNVIEYDKRRGTVWGAAVDKMSKRLNEDKISQWTVRESSGKNEKVENICSKISSELCSYPILSLAGEYLADLHNIKQQGPPQTWADHCVIALDCSEKECLIFDPYTLMLGLDTNPMFSMSSDKLFRYWIAPFYPCKMMWFEITQRPLTDFEGVR